MKNSYTYLFLVLVFPELLLVVCTSFSNYEYDYPYEINEEPLPGSSTPSNTEENVVQVSESMFQNISSFSDLSELQAILGIANVNPMVPVVTLESGPNFRSSKTDKFISNPVQAHCQPELQPVDLGLINTNNVTYYPTCVRINQCGGCCPKKDIYSCQPIASKKVMVKVLKLRRQNRENEVSTPRPNRNRRRSQVSVSPQYIAVTAEEHTECRCMCRLRETECDLTVQIYDSHSCQCKCKNFDEENKCLEKSTHVWNKKKCQCLCRNILVCSSSDTFDHKSCKCKPLKTRVTFNDVNTPENSRDYWFANRRKPVPAPTI